MRKLSRLALCLISVSVSEAASAKVAISAEEATFRRWLVHYLKADRQLRDTNETFGYSLVDLNGDGRKEAVAWVTGRFYCGTGGCSLQVFRRTKSGWRLFADAGIAHTPIKLLAIRTHGWRDLSEWQYGGGTYRPFEAWLRFNGREYNNQGAKVPRGIHGRIIINDANFPLFPSKCRRAKEGESVFGPMSMPTGKAGSC